MRSAGEMGGDDAADANVKTDAGLNTTVTVALFLCGTSAMRLEIMAKMDKKKCSK